MKALTLNISLPLAAIRNMLLSMDAFEADQRIGACVDEACETFREEIAKAICLLVSTPESEMPSELKKENIYDC